MNQNSNSCSLINSINKSLISPTKFQNLSSFREDQRLLDCHRTRHLCNIIYSIEIEWYSYQGIQQSKHQRSCQPCFESAFLHFLRTYHAQTRIQSQDSYLFQISETCIHCIQLPRGSSGSGVRSKPKIQSKIVFIVVSIV